MQQSKQENKRPILCQKTPADKNAFGQLNWSFVQTVNLVQPLPTLPDYAVIF